MVTQLPRRVTRYIYLSAVPALAVVAVALAVDRYPSIAAPWLIYPLVIAIGWAGEEYRVRTRQGAAHTLTAAIHLPLILVFTPLEAIALSTISTVCALVRRRRPLSRVAYNGVVRVLAVGVPSLLLALWRAHDPHFDGRQTFLNTQTLWSIAAPAGRSTWLPAWPAALFSGEVAGGCVLATLLYFSVESALVSAIIALQTATSPLAAWQVNIRANIWPELTKSVIGIIAACIYVVAPIFLAFVAVPVAMTHAATRRIFLMERETVDAVTALADAIDFRDPYTAQHSVRVADTSRRLALRLGLPQDQVDEITLAARVHDLGKIGIPNEILLKPGKLTAEEMAVMQTHPQVGVDILRKYHHFRHALPIVLHHHERYDGKGYPHGLSGSAIPVGARVVAHADAYDAMISDRPYRKGMRPEVAVQRIGEASGTQFDPAVAGAFVAMMREDLAAAGQHLPDTGGSLATHTEPHADAHPAPDLPAAVGAGDNVRYLFRP